MRTMKKVLLAFSLSTFAIAGFLTATPVIVSAQAAAPEGDPKNSSFQIVPCDGVSRTLDDGTITEECDFNSLIEMANRVIRFLLYLSIPFILGIIVYTAFKYLTANGNPGKLADAKSMLKYVFIGLLWILGSFILVYTVLDQLLDGNIKTEQQGVWNSYFKQ